MKQICIVYNPGYAGNFLQRLFSLGTGVAPVLSKAEITSASMKLLSPTEKTEKYKFSNIVNDYHTWQDFHRNTADMYEYDDIISTITPYKFSHVIFSTHDVERYYRVELTDQFPGNEFIMIGVSLDLDRYGTWIKNAQQSLEFLYRLEEKEFYIKFLSNLPTEMIINLTAMLESEDSFIIEYRRVCAVLGLAAYNEPAITLYRNWYQTRVQCFLD